MPIATQISLDQAKPNKLFYLVATVVVYRPSDGRCLVLKRSQTETAHPGRYAVPGGKLEWKDLDLDHPTRVNGQVLDYEQAIEKLLQREVKEEAGITITGPLHYLSNVAYIRPDGIPSLLVKFAATYLSGEVQLEEGSFTDYAWVNAEEITQLESVDGIAQEVAQTIAIFQL